MTATSLQAIDSASFSGGVISRSAETTDRYENRVALLLANYQLDASGCPSLPGFAAWLKDRRSVLATSSFRQYRAASISVFEAILDVKGLRPSLGMEVQRAVAILDSTRGTPLSPRGQIPSRTSALKQKRICEQDWAKIVAALLDSHRRHAPAVLLLFTAGLVTGLRPCEWINAELFEDAENEWKLEVQNGKSTNGRSHGPTRSLSWSGCSTEVHAIQDWLAHIATQLPRDRRRARKVWETYYAQLRDTLGEVSQEVWPRRTRRPTFYTARHTFAAAAKAVLSRAEVGALLGHGTDLTALTHYARPPKGGSKLPAFKLPAPNPAEVMRVRHLLEAKLSTAKPLQRRADTETNRIAAP
ncbi:hypothetical protein H9Q09_19055 [Aurantimonas sp. DM33-3]|uniref:hypothetical protein n=1 Tax=Aurantimonas sp. DM33-3 TaxID=2766955 RepID=UPI0016529153|nr:hypothetical protein [Aurantimonas sp. DM33-3]MBC6718285.1 hypothetical protein [Aurantimonas sp. DM33-3]